MRWGSIGNAKSDQIIEEVGGGEKKISRQWFSALLRIAPACIVVVVCTSTTCTTSLPCFDLLRLALPCIISPHSKTPAAGWQAQGHQSRVGEKKVASFYFLSFVYLRRIICWPSVNRAVLSEFQKACEDSELIQGTTYITHQRGLLGLRAFV